MFNINVIHINIIVRVSAISRKITIINLIGKLVS